MKKLFHRLILSLGCATSLVAPALHAQSEYPSRPIRIVVGYAPGGASDSIARRLATSLSEKLNQPVVVDNRPGANTAIAAQNVANSPPDGYSLLAADPSGIVLNAHLFKKPGYSGLGFVPISKVAGIPLAIMVPASSPITDIKGFATAAKSGNMTYGSPGLGNLNHLAMELFQRSTGTTLTHVPYKGSAPAIQDLLSGQIGALFADVPSALPHIKAGKIRALAIAAPSRVTALPEIPTFKEAGISGVDVDSWLGLFAPANTPPAMVGALAQAVQETVASPAMRDWLQSMALQPRSGITSEFRASIKQEDERYGRVIREAGISLD